VFFVSLSEEMSGYLASFLAFAWLSRRRTVTGAQVRRPYAHARAINASGEIQLPAALQLIDGLVRLHWVARACAHPLAHTLHV
jgi:hypothetical protein